MNVIKFQDTIFIEESHSFKMAARARETESYRMQLGTFWGYKFEALSTLPDWPANCTQDQIDSREDEVVSNEAKWCSLVRTGFDTTRVVIAGEVDACK